MSKRVYLLLTARPNKASDVISALQGKEGIVTADKSEDQTTVIVILEARDRKKLATQTVNALLLAEDFISDSQVLPVKSPKHQISLCSVAI